VKITSQEEYGIRCLLQFGRKGPGGTLTIPEIGRAERLSKDYVAKLMRVLRKGGLVKSVRGQGGGYRLTRPLEEITVADALAALGGRLYDDPVFCDQHGMHGSCTHETGCSLRSLWRSVQDVVDQVLGRTTLSDLLHGDPVAPPPPAPPSRLTTIRVN
jgi:Rrf2 family protein